MAMLYLYLFTPITNDPPVVVVLFSKMVFKVLGVLQGGSFTL